MRCVPCFLGLAATLLTAALVMAADKDAPTADEQILKQAGLPTDDAALLDFFRKRSPSDAEMRELIRKLGDDSYEVREKATKDLTALGPVAEPYLREALKSGDAEVVRRCEEIIKKIGTGPSAGVIAAAARLLGRRKPAGAAEVLLNYIPKVEGESPEEDVRAALSAVAVRDGKPEPALVAALADKVPGKRSAAAVALVKAGVKENLPAVRKLLEDADASVRWHVALALVGLKEKDAVPVLIDLLPVLTRNQLPPVEDLLYRLAEDKAPQVIAGSDPESRKKYRDAWASWWRDEGSKLDLTKLDQAPKFLGYTMVVFLDAGRIIEVDAEGKTRWQIDDLSFPLDAQLLPGERVLIAEFRGGRVTERNRKGEVLWSKQVQDPLMAQRLPNGNTFIATRFQLLEVDRNGKQVFSYMRPQGDLIMKAQKRPNGEIGFVTDAGLFVRLDPTGKEIGQFRVDLRTSGGRIDLLPNGRVLVPLKDQNKVVEYDSQGKIVWEVSFPDPVNAVRLPNGHTMITSYQATRAAEVDAAGKTVYEYKSDLRVTRAWRR